MEAGFEVGEQASSSVGSKADSKADSEADSKADTEADRQVDSVVDFKTESASRQAGFVIDIEAIFIAVDFGAGFLVDLVTSTVFTACNWLLPRRFRHSSFSEGHAMY